MAKGLRLSEAELEAMADLPHIARCAYIFGIRRYMDYATGVVGERREVSYQGISEELFVEHQQGRQDAGRPHKSAVRRVVATLERAGLIRVQSRGKKLVFQCLLADTDESAQEKADTRPTHVRHTEGGTQPDAQPGTKKMRSGAGSTGKADTQPGTDSDTPPTHPEGEKADTPPESGIRGEEAPSVSPPSSKQAKAADLDVSVLPEDLSEHVWRDWLQWRKDKKAPVKTQTVVNTVARELEKARALGWPPDEALAEAMVAGWQGVKAEWLQNRTRGNVAPFPQGQQGHRRRTGFSDIDHEGEARRAGFKTEVE